MRPLLRFAVATARLGARGARRLSWSLPLCFGAAVFFARLASEMREGELDAFDEAIQRWVAGVRGAPDSLMLACTRAGGPLPMTLLTLGVLVILVICRQLRQARFLALAAGGSLLLNLLLKAGFQRARPGETWVYLLPTLASLSFPSGHTMGSTGVIAGLLVLLWQGGAPRGVRIAALVSGAAFVIGVGASRVYFGLHYPSDVLGGWLAAMAWVSAVTGWMYPRLLPGTKP